MISSIKELNGFLDRRASAFERALLALLKSRYAQGGDEEQAFSNLTALLGATLVLAQLHGRRRTLLEADRLREAPAAAFEAKPEKSPLSMGLAFEEAVEDLLAREPRLVSSAREIAELYSQGKVFAMAKSISRRLTERVQAAITQMMISGENLGKGENEILRIASEESHDWVRAYASTVYRTNVANAYTEGRLTQVQNPEVAEVVKAFEFVGIDDARTRPNHRAAHGLIAAIDDPIWARMRPPLGYQCRCGIIFAGRYTLERKGLINKDGSVKRYEPPGFSAAGPDAGFKGGEL